MVAHGPLSGCGPADLARVDRELRLQPPDEVALRPEHNHGKRSIQVSGLGGAPVFQCSGTFWPLAAAAGKSFPPADGPLLHAAWIAPGHAVCTYDLAHHPADTGPQASAEGSAHLRQLLVPAPAQGDGAARSAQRTITNRRGVCFFHS